MSGIRGPRFVQEISYEELVRKRRLNRAALIARDRGDFETLRRLAKATVLGSTRLSARDPRTASDFGTFCIVNAIPPRDYLKMKPLELAALSLGLSNQGTDYSSRASVDRSVDVSKLGPGGGYAMMEPGEMMLLIEFCSVMGYEQFVAACTDPTVKYDKRLKHFVEVSCRMMT